MNWNNCLLHWRRDMHLLSKRFKLSSTLQPWCWSCSNLFPMLLGLHVFILQLNIMALLSCILFMHSLYLCTTCIHIGSEEEVPVEYVIVEEENPQELPPEGEGQVSGPLPECPNPPLFAEASPGHFTFPPISILNYTWVMLDNIVH